MINAGNRAPVPPRRQQHLAVLAANALVMAVSSRMAAGCNGLRESSSTRLEVSPVGVILRVRNPVGVSRVHRMDSRDRHRAGPVDV